MIKCLRSLLGNDAQYALDIVKAICAGIGPGVPASSQEKERADFLGKEMESHLGAENVVLEEFTFAPKAFLGTYPLSMRSRDQISATRQGM